MESDIALTQSENLNLQLQGQAVQVPVSLGTCS